MLKIYLDWNVITHLKDDADASRELLNAIIEYRDYFIFPFSAAHLRDLSRGDANCPGYKKDQEILDVICGTHLLEYNKKTDSAYPYQCTPSEYFERNRDVIELYKSGFTENSFSTLFANCGLDFTEFVNGLEKFEVPPITIPNQDICIRNAKEGFSVLTQFGESLATDKNLSKKSEQYIRDNTTEQQYNSIKHANVDTVFDELNKITIPSVGMTFVDIIRKFVVSQNDSDFFIALYLALNAIGFRIDKKRDFLNVYADAEHAYYASKCDVFVTNDSKLVDKAQAIYYYFGKRIQIISGKQLKDFMECVAKHVYDLDYLYNKIVPVYGKPKRVEGDWLYYDQMPYPFWGLFNSCSEMDIPKSSSKIVILRNIISRNGFVYFTELEIFFKYVESLFEENGKEAFRKEYRDVFLSRNKERILRTGFSFILDDYHIRLIADPDSAVPLPVVLIQRG